MYRTGLESRAMFYIGLALGIVVVVMVGTGLLAVFLVRRLGKGNRRKRGRYCYSEKAQQAAGKSDGSGGVERVDFRPSPTMSTGAEKLGQVLESPLLNMIRATTKPVDASKFGKSIKTTPMKLDRRFLKNAPQEEEVEENNTADEADG
jgi:hypothetical protein